MLKIYGISLLFAVFLLYSGSNAQNFKEPNGIINGTLLQNLSQFPHQVGIHIRGNEPIFCSGSILAHRWVLTQGACIYWNPNSEVTLMFNRRNINITAPLEPASFTIKINITQHVQFSSYNFDEMVPALALIYLPVSLDFGNGIAPIAVANDPHENLTGSYAVMAGIKQNTTQESYGQFEIMPYSYCANNSVYFNSTREICTAGWQKNGNIPCLSTAGGGLLVDWPIAPRLVGVFSGTQSCSSYPLPGPAAYFKVSHFLDWIESVVGQHVKYFM